MTKEDLNISDEELLNHLGLIREGSLTKAAVLLFYRYPDRIFAGASVMIGRFTSGPDLLYQDELTGSLMIQAKRVMDMIYTKYLIGPITYENNIHVENYPYPKEAIREAVYNALVHNNYAYGVPIQIRVEDYLLSISNCCSMSIDFNVENLLKSRKSHPYNPLIAQTFYRTGFIESWGRGITKIITSCKENGACNPEFDITDMNLTVTFVKKECLKNKNVPLKVKGNYNYFYGKEYLTDKILFEMKRVEHPTTEKLAKILKVSRKTIQRKISQLRKLGIVERVGSKKTGYWKIIKNK